MLERIIENWLIKTNERGYEIPFTQVLLAEGHRVLYGPVHHPYEHGKDIIAFDTSGLLCAVQTKSDDISLADFERMQGQLLALTGTAVDYPGVEPPRRPDRVILVTNGNLSAPARDRMGAFNQAHRALGHPILECVEREQLLARFLAAHGKFLPRQPDDLGLFLKFSLGDGNGPFPVKQFGEFLLHTIDSDKGSGSSLATSRSLASAVLLTRYATEAWERCDNHLGGAEGWLCLTATILHCACRDELEDSVWNDSYDLALTAARSSLYALLHTASEAEDLINHHLVDGAVYPTRALAICGVLCGYFHCERQLGIDDHIRDRIIKVIEREIKYIKVISEGGAPFVLMIALVLERLGAPEEACRYIQYYAEDLTRSNQRQSATALPDPYHDFEDALRRLCGAEVEIPDERFDGGSYTLHLMINWLARRNQRETVASLWPMVTRLRLMEFKVSAAANLLKSNDADGNLIMWQAAMPQSWKDLHEGANRMSESELPGPLWRHLEFLPYLVLLFPYRFVTSTEKAMDYLIGGTVKVDLDVSGD